jgi:hypothetical protein
LAIKPLKILAVYLSPSRPLIASDVSACLGSGLPVLMVGEMNAKHIDCQACRMEFHVAHEMRQTCVTMLLRIHAFLGRTNYHLPYNPCATPDVLNITITKTLFSPVYLTTCSALRSDHLRILIDTRCRSSFLSPPDCSDLRTDWPKFQACLEAGLPSNPDLTNEVAIDACVKELTYAISKALKLHSQVSPTS